MRFADVKNCCFNSQSNWYSDFGSQQELMALWLDPLSFCFHIQKRDALGVWLPCGFIFGGFGVASKQTTVLLNGVYLNAQKSPHRIALIHALEQQFAAPLNIRQIAIGNQHGGAGALPSAYKNRRRLL